MIPNIDLGRLIVKAAVSGGDNVVNRQSHMVYFFVLVSNINKKYLNNSEIM